jgi:hypothetical protein
VLPEKVAVADTLHLLNLGGVIGQCTSANPDVGPPCRVEVLGQVLPFPHLGERRGTPARRSGPTPCRWRTPSPAPCPAMGAVQIDPVEAGGGAAAGGGREGLDDAGKVGLLGRAGR